MHTHNNNNINITMILKGKTSYYKDQRKAKVEISQGKNREGSYKGNSLHARDLLLVDSTTFSQHKML